MHLFLEYLLNHLLPLMPQPRHLLKPQPLHRLKHLLLLLLTLLFVPLLVLSIYVLNLFVLEPLAVPLSPPIVLDSSLILVPLLLAAVSLLDVNLVLPLPAHLLPVDVLKLEEILLLLDVALKFLNHVEVPAILASLMDVTLLLEYVSQLLNAKIRLIVALKSFVMD
jgi:hypothetical protein